MRVDLKIHCLILTVRCVEDTFSATAKQTGPEGKVYSLVLLS